MNTKILIASIFITTLLSLYIYKDQDVIYRTPSSLRDVFTNCISAIKSFKKSDEKLIDEVEISDTIEFDDFDDVGSFFNSHYFNLGETISESKENSRLLKFMNFSMNRYADEYTEKISERIYKSTDIVEYHTEDADLVQVSISKIGNSLKVEIPLILMRGSALTTNANTNRIAKVLAPIFYATLAHLNDPSLRNVDIVLKDIVNPDLAKMVSKLGFISEHFSKKLNFEEIENILGKNRIKLPEKVEEPDFDDFDTEEAYEAAVEKWEDYEIEVSDIINNINSTTEIAEGSKSLTFRMSMSAK